MDQAEDVEVIIGHKRRYKFHSGTLARNSTFFADMLTEAKAAKLNSKAKAAGVKIRWMFELARLPDDLHPGGCLQLVNLDPTGERLDGRSGLIVNENGRIPTAHKAFTHYESVFYAFYNKELTIDDTDMRTALGDCDELLNIAEYLGCARLISKPIEVALLKHGQDLFRGIQAMPHLWINMACRIRSELIFKECMIHLVGNWKKVKLNKALYANLRESPDVCKMIEKYHRQLLFQCRSFEHAIAFIYPGDMEKPVDDHPIKRESYAKDILVWMALSFYRQWFNDRLHMDKGRHATDCGYSLYKVIGAAGDAYLDRPIMIKFQEKFPMTQKALTVVENHLTEIKEVMKEIVEKHKILDANCQLDVNRFPVDYLTCTEFRREDCPWLKEANNKPRRVAAKRQYKPGGNDIARQNLETTRRDRQRSGSIDEMDNEDIEDEDDDDDLEALQPKRKRLTASDNSSDDDDDILSP